MVGVTLTGLQMCRSLGLQYYTGKYLNRSFTDMMASWVPGLTAAIPVGVSIAFVAGLLRTHHGIPTVLQLIVCIMTGLGVSSMVYATLFRRSVFDPLVIFMRIRRPGLPIQDECLRKT
jgi:hypothetical protein